MRKFAPMIQAKEVKEQINRFAWLRKPFLFAVDYEMKQGFLIENPINERSILWRVGQYTNVQQPAICQTQQERKPFNITPISEDIYRKKFEIIQHHLHQGNSFLANLTVSTPISTGYSLKEVFERSNSPYAIFYPGRFVCFSPEIFVRIGRTGVISSFPMKGTIDAETDNAKEIILNNAKEAAEHFTVVDLIRSDISHIAHNVRVERLRYIDALTTSKGRILQVSSEIKGDITGDWHHQLGDKLWELLPAGSITGAPKPSTIRAIAEAEQDERGFYTGIFGYFDGETLDSAVMIRYIEETEKGLIFRSGGGITVNSNCYEEYQEVLKKVYLPF